MSAVINYYSILGVSQTAKKREITIAYRKLALKYHPDLIKSNETLIDFSEINEAYRNLCDSQLRAKLDQALKVSINQNSGIKAPKQFSPINQIKNIYWPTIIQKLKKFTKVDTNSFYSDLELSKSFAEEGGYQEFAFQIINQDSLGNEIRKEKKLKISIPAKIKDGTILHLKGFKDEYIDEIHFKIKVVN